MSNIQEKNILMIQTVNRFEDNFSFSQREEGENMDYVFQQETTFLSTKRINLKITDWA